jgi:hypothetical protein
MAELRSAQQADVSAIVAIDPHRPARPGGLDEGDPELVFFHDVR